MKVAYLGKMLLADVDLSFLHVAQRKADVTYFLEVTPRYMRSPAFTLSRIYGRTGVFKAVEAYPELSQYADYIDLDKFYVVNSVGRWWILKSLWANLLLLAFLVRRGFDAVHLAWPLNVYEFILYALRRRMVLTVHDPFPHTEENTRIVRLRRKVSFACVRQFLVLNRAQRDDFLAYYRMDSTRVAMSQLGSYSCLCEVKPARNCVPAGRYVLFVGKVSKYKGLEYLMPAIVKVHETHPDVRLVVAGSGKFSFDMEAYRSLGYVEIRNRFIPVEEMVALVRGAEFVVCPYTEATQSGVVMSAFAFGKPVVATRVGGLPEMLGGGEFGVLVPAGNIGELAEAIGRLWADGERLEQLSANIHRAYDAGDRSWENIVGGLLPLYGKGRIR